MAILLARKALRAISLQVRLLGFSLATVVSAASAGTVTNLDVCLFAYDAAAGQAKYRVSITWGTDVSVADGRRIDLAASDSSGDVWPQFRDSRLSKTIGTFSEEFIAIGDQSGYPLQFFLIGMNATAAEQFDRSCRGGGFCSIRLPREGVALVGAAARAGITAVGSAPRCTPRGM